METIDQNFDTSKANDDAVGAYAATYALGYQPWDPAAAAAAKVQVKAFKPSPEVEQMMRNQARHVVAPSLAAAKATPMLPGAAEKDAKNDVKRVDEATRVKKYEVELGATMLRRGKTFDTRDIKAHFLAKRGITTPFTKPEDKGKAADKSKAGIGAQVLAPDGQEKLFAAVSKEWNEQSLIWVCVKPTWKENAEAPVFLSHVGKIDKFHHSTLGDGKGVLGAGEWIVEKGKLKKISANSGHYQPTLDFLHQSVLYMSAAWQEDTVVLVWNVKDDAWEEVPVQLFKAGPSGGGKWKAHPMSK